MSTRPVSTGVVGATGYTGVELVEWLADHPTFDLQYLGSRTYAGESLSSVYPRMGGRYDYTCEEIQPDRWADLELLFTAVPHGQSMQWIGSIDRDHTRVVDLAADYRFVGDPRRFERVYDRSHEDPEGLNQAVYGLTEFNRSALSSATLVANPGCYATAVLLALTPLLERELLEFPVFVDAKSGISGACRSPSPANTYVNVSQEVKPYKVSGHRHQPEMLHHLPGDPVLRFVPHVVAADRGIEAALYAPLKSESTAERVEETLRSVCEQHEMLRLREQPAGIKAVARTPFCDITVAARPESVVVFSCLDNLLKGAATQAIQNANLMFGRPINEGLS